MRSDYAIKKYQPPVLLCQLAIASVTAVWATRGEWLNVGVGGVCLLLSVISMIYAQLGNSRSAAATVVALLLAAHVSLGMFLGLYEHSSVYDKFMHVAGSIGIAFIVYAILDAYSKRRQLNLPTVLHATLVFSVTLSAGAVWEVFEFSMDQSGLFYAQRGLTDTMIDLIADGLGALIAILVFLPGSAERLRSFRISLWRSVR